MSPLETTETEATEVDPVGMVHDDTDALLPEHTLFTEQDKPIDLSALDRTPEVGATGLSEQELDRRERVFATILSLRPSYTPKMAADDVLTVLRILRG